MSNKAHVFFLLITLFLAVFLRFYKLGQVPYGFYQDESAIGYNAYSILKTGKDEHAEALPLYFKSFGDYKLPLYVYLTTLSVSYFGLSEFAIRFPSALFGSLSIIALYFFLLRLTNKKNLSLAASLLLVINPWHLHYSRATFEVSVSLFLFVLGGFLLVVSLQAKKRGCFLLGTLCFIAGLYSYNLARLLSPLLYVSFLLVLKKHLRRVGRAELLFTVLFCLVALMPFLATLLKSGGIRSAAGTLLTSSAVVQAKILELRSYLVSLSPVFVKTFFNMAILMLWQYLKHIASYLSISFFFIEGSQHGNHGIGNVGQFYLFELPLVLIGIYKALREKTIATKLLFVWAALVIAVASFTREAPHATRSFFLVVPIIYLSAVGLVTLLRYQRVIVLAVCVLALYNVVYYFTSYYVAFPRLYAKAWRSEDRTLSRYLLEHQHKYDRIIFDREAGFVYTSLLFYQKISPPEYQKGAVYSPDDEEGFSMLSRFGTYEFRNVDWAKDLQLRRTLIITSGANKPGDVAAFKIFSYPRRPVVLAMKGKVIQYPVDEIAYVLVETK